MSDSPKYLVHAAFRANGVVERNDVVGAVFGQTEGLLGDDLDLRDLQQSSKVGRIDVTLDTEAGRTYGTLTIASGLDRVETALLAAALETIERVGPARAQFELDSIEDAREAKRRQVVDRATELLADLEATSTTSRDLVEAVREEVRVADPSEYEGLPAGPRVEASDAIVIVEGRSDVMTLLRYGVRNAIAAEGTDVPDALADLTENRTATAFLDGDRGGELICRELAQVADLDHVAFAPEGLAVEDLDRAAVTAGLRGKVTVETVLDAPSPRAAFYEQSRVDAAVTHPEGPPREGEVAADDTSEPPADDGEGNSQDPTRAAANGGATGVEGTTGSAGAAAAAAGATDAAGPDAEGAGVDAEGGGDEDGISANAAQAGETGATVADTSASATEEESPEAGDTEARPETLPGHVAAVVGQGTEGIRLLDRDMGVLAEGPAGDAVGLLEDADPVPHTVVLDGTLSQAVLDVAAQRGVGQVVARREGEFVKRPTGVRTRTADEF